jgi:hypothetical protein
MDGDGCGFFTKRKLKAALLEIMHMLFVGLTAVTPSAA